MNVSFFLSKLFPLKSEIVPPASNKIIFPAA